MTTIDNLFYFDSKQITYKELIYEKIDEENYPVENEDIAAIISFR